MMILLIMLAEFILVFLYIPRIFLVALVILVSSKNIIIRIPFKDVVFLFIVDRSQRGSLVSEQGNDVRLDFIKFIMCNFILCETQFVFSGSAANA